MSTAQTRRRFVLNTDATDMEEKRMHLYTQELDVLEMALRYFALGCETTEKDREICQKIIDAISEKDEAYLVY